MKFAEKLVRLRKEHNLSQEQLAEKLGVSRQAVSRWEAGETTPDLLNLLGICNVFNVSADSLIRDDREITGFLPQGETPAAKPAFSRKERLFRLISGALAQAGMIFSVCGICFSHNSCQFVVSTLCAGVLAGLATYSFVRYGRLC